MDKKFSWNEIHAGATAFSKRWQGAKREKAEAQSFLKEFLQLFGVDTALRKDCFEYPINKKWIDFFLPKQLVVEMKSLGENLDDAYEQLKGYMEAIPADDVPDLWMVCDFNTIILWRRSIKERRQFKLKDLHKNIKHFASIAGYATERSNEDKTEVNVKAAEKMAKLHDALKNLGYDGHCLEVYLVRLLFCLFAEDTGIFHSDAFFNYVSKSKSDGSDLADRLRRLFETLDMQPDIRAKRTAMPEELRNFQYINGSLFRERLVTPDFDAKMRQTLLDCLNFDWSLISPAIFGTMFQGVMNAKERRELGAHYTSEENILKLLNPLFLDELYKEFERVKTDPVAIEHFHCKLASLKFLDPACGCGNFLIIAYRELRRLEIEVLKMKLGNRHPVLDVSHLIKVNVEQFYGIEREEFPCQIARVGLWLTEHQMNREAAVEFGNCHPRLPLQKGAAIAQGNALRIDWETAAPKSELSYIMGNPPFAGARIMLPEQKDDMLHVFGNKFKGVGNLDYVSAWYKKAAEYTHSTNIKCAFVSTNSITQGEQVPLLWKPLIEKGICINFGVPTFKWSNEAKGKAAVYCVIAGFSYQKTEPNINPYLLEAPTIFIESRSKPLCDAPEIGIGNKPIDGGHYLFTETEKDEFLKKEPQAEKWFKKWIGSDEFINRYFRYCLWLGDCSPDELRKMPESMKRIEAVRQFRLKSESEGTRKIAEFPRRFHVENMPQGTYIIIPSTSSERRKYIPIGFITPDIIASNATHIIPNATLYHFGILTSIVHNAWTRAVCGRLEMRYRYSKDIVYNNFPWPKAADSQKSEIEKLAQAILDARAKFPESSLAALYDPLTMPPELLKAHQALDRAVMKLYGFGKDMGEPEVAARLFAMRSGS